MLAPCDVKIIAKKFFFLVSREVEAFAQSHFVESWEVQTIAHQFRSREKTAQRTSLQSWRVKKNCPTVFFSIFVKLKQLPKFFFELWEIQTIVVGHFFSLEKLKHF